MTNAMKPEDCVPGVYRLTRYVPAPLSDKRQKSDWRYLPCNAGMSFIIADTRDERREVFANAAPAILDALVASGKVTLAEIDAILAQPEGDEKKWTLETLLKMANEEGECAAQADIESRDVTREALLRGPFGDAGWEFHEVLGMIFDETTNGPKTAALDDETKAAMRAAFEAGYLKHAKLMLEDEPEDD